MALQGDLHSFALPDVLRLLAGTTKTGRLVVTGDAGSGDVWLQEGDVIGGAVTSSPHAQSAADIVFELLRFDGGSFVFEDDAEPDGVGDRSSVDDAIAHAEDLLREWHEVEAVVPSVHSWVALKPELDGEQTTVSAPQWRALAALGGGATVRDLGDHFDLTDLGASRQVKELVESGLVHLGDVREHEDFIGTAPAHSFDADDADLANSEPIDDLAVLRADDGPVVLETRDDALLPEPLPDEGTSFEGDLSELGTVDGRSFESEINLDGSDEASEFVEPVVEDSYDSVPSVGFGASVPSSMETGDPAEEAAWTTFASGDTMVDHLDDGYPSVGEGVAGDPLDDVAGADTGVAAGSDEPSDAGERGSLLKFLSSTKH